MMQKRKYQNGFSMVEALIAVGLLVTTGLLGSSIAVFLENNNRYSSEKAGFQAISDSLIATATHQSSWDYTRQNNAAMACSRTYPSSCANGTQSPVALYNAAGVKITDPSNPKMGFKLNGETCQNFDTGQDGCVYRASVQWSVHCSSAQDCQYPEEKVSINFKYKGVAVLNVSSFDVPPTVRTNLSSNQSPTSSCAHHGTVFVGYGNTVYDGDGGAHSPDSLGCISLAAFRGATGPQGPMGATGATGPAGPDGGLTFLPPPMVLAGGSSDPGSSGPSASAPPPPPPAPPVVAAATPPPVVFTTWWGGRGRIDTGSPLMVHFNAGGEMYQPLKFTDPLKGILFDLLGLNAKPAPHTKKRISWYRSPQYYFLALPNTQGEVRGINELFGDNTLGPDGKFAADGYKALAKYDSNNDHYITEKDDVFHKLRLWNDINFDGTSQKHEMLSLTQMGIVAIDLNADPNYKETDQYGNQSTLKSVVKTKDGKFHLIFDIWFVYLP